MMIRNLLKIKTLVCLCVCLLFAPLMQADLLCEIVEEYIKVLKMDEKDRGLEKAITRWLLFNLIDLKNYLPPLEFVERSIQTWISGENQPIVFFVKEDEFKEKLLEKLKGSEKSMEGLPSMEGFMEKNPYNSLVEIAYNEVQATYQSFIDRIAQLKNFYQEASQDLSSASALQKKELLARWKGMGKLLEEIGLLKAQMLVFLEYMYNYYFDEQHEVGVFNKRKPEIEQVKSSEKWRFTAGKMGQIALTMEEEISAGEYGILGLDMTEVNFPDPYKRGEIRKKWAIEHIKQQIDDFCGNELRICKRACGEWLAEHVNWKMCELEKVFNDFWDSAEELNEEKNSLKKCLDEVIGSFYDEVADYFDKQFDCPWLLQKLQNLKKDNGIKVRCAKRIADAYAAQIKQEWKTVIVPYVQAIDALVSHYIKMCNFIKKREIEFVCDDVKVDMEADRETVKIWHQEYQTKLDKAKKAEKGFLENLDEFNQDRLRLRDHIGKVVDWSEPLLNRLKGYGLLSEEEVASIKAFKRPLKVGSPKKVLIAPAGTRVRRTAQTMGKASGQDTKTDS